MSTIGHEKWKKCPAIFKEGSSEKMVSVLVRMELTELVVRMALKNNWRKRCFWRFFLTNVSAVVESALLCTSRLLCLLKSGQLQLISFLLFLWDEPCWSVNGHIPSYLQCHSHSHFTALMSQILLKSQRSLVVLTATCNVWKWINLH